MKTISSILLSSALALICGPLPGAEIHTDGQGEVKLLAEVRVPNGQSSGQGFRWVPAAVVKEGQEICYTLRIRNPGTAAVTALTVVHAIPYNMHYVANTATGAGAEIRFSADGGRSFGTANELRLPGDPSRLIPAGQYTHIRWQLRHPLAPQSIALARFRAIFQ